MTTRHDTDKTTRLARIEHLMFQAGKQGMTVEKMASMCEVSKRTIQRDLYAIQRQNLFPIWEEKRHYGIDASNYLPPIRFSMSEALNVFLAARLMASYANRRDPDITNIFTKLNCVLQSPLREEVQQTIDWMNTLPENERVSRNLACLAEAWINRKKARISYRSLPSDKAATRVIDPYFIQPAAAGHSAYVLAYCHKNAAVRTFKVERIESICLEDETYEIPKTYDATKLLSLSFGIVTAGRPAEVHLKALDEDMARLFQETTWHPSQQIRKENGGVIAVFKVPITYEFVSWIMGWGNYIEVLKPQSLRQRVKREIDKMVEIYGKSRGSSREKKQSVLTDDEKGVLGPAHGSVEP